MPVSYFVFYRGQAEKPDAFIDHYRNIHVPILSTWPGIESICLHTPLDWSDTHPVRKAGIALAAEMTFRTMDDFQQALRSEGRIAARRDFECFPRFVGDVFHQAMSSEKLK
jgi:uncharacterized protein (TIGR02118 family)